MEKEQGIDSTPTITTRIVSALGEVAAATERGVEISTAIVESRHLSLDEKVAILLQDPAAHYKTLAQPPYCYKLSENRPAAAIVFDRLRAAHAHLDPAIYKSAMRSYSDFTNV